MMPEAMGVLEFMPLVMVQGFVLVQIDGIEDLGLGMGKMILELIPGDPAVPIVIHMPEMGVERFGVGHGFFVILGRA